MVLVTIPDEVVVVAYGQMMVVDVSTTVVIPPMVCVPEGRAVEVAPQTVVDSVKVMVTAGMV